MNLMVDFCCNVNSSLSSETWPFSLEWLPPTAYLVGGAVRDALLGRHSQYLDLDFIVPTGAVKLAKQIANFYQAGFVLLDAQRQIARVVFEQATVDFAQQEGPTLEADLHRRDFTVNAIAYNPHTREFVDPHKGYTDLQQKLLRMISSANLQADCLRLLRAYRQAAQLDFTLDAATQAAIRKLAPNLSQIAPERVRVEVGYLLASSQGTPWLIRAWEDGLLGVWFHHTTQASCEQLVAVDGAFATLAASWEKLSEQLCQPVRASVKTSWLAIAKLSCLVPLSPETAELELQQLKYSKVEIRAVTTALKLLPNLQALAETAPLSLTQQYFLFRDAGVVFPTIALLAVATGTPVAAIAPLIERYLDPSDPIAHPIPLVSGQDLMQALNLPPGPEIGELLSAIAIAQIEGKVSSADAALRFAALFRFCSRSGTS